MVRRPIVSRGPEADFRAVADIEVRLHVNGLLGTLHPRTRSERKFIFSFLAMEEVKAGLRGHQ